MYTSTCMHAYSLVMTPLFLRAFSIRADCEYLTGVDQGLSPWSWPTKSDWKNVC